MKSTSVVQALMVDALYTTMRSNIKQARYHRETSKQRRIEKRVTNTNVGHDGAARDAGQTEFLDNMVS